MLKRAELVLGILSLSKDDRGKMRVDKLSAPGVAGILSLSKDDREKMRVDKLSAPGVAGILSQIGRASCRERVSSPV